MVRGGLVVSVLRQIVFAAVMFGAVLRCNRLGGCVGGSVFDDLAPDALAAAAAAVVTVTRATAAGMLLVFLIGLAMGAFLGLD